MRLALGFAGGFLVALYLNRRALWEWWWQEQ